MFVGLLPPAKKKLVAEKFHFSVLQLGRREWLPRKSFNLKEAYEMRQSSSEADGVPLLVTQ